ncbi:hypothetical protein DVK00_19165 [Haloarcula sp. Atlit-47R]|uniref:hypothetical protein n=1 Tax=Haloarcula sp. Atlit-47R TaxID=2282132 RepID=UPI000EF1CA33|nr:hypothetical protein [Haloarcula sp. Atlit-47R]RLM41959.1 hypothetical protein DVK00_19165 [Haloarcula sp. Atlit-47R]
MQTIPTTISKNWVETLTETEGIDRSTAKTIVTSVIGDPRLMLDSVNSPEDIEFATRVAYEDLGQFDVSEIEVSDQEWDTIRRRLVERLHENLHEQYWDQEVPVVEDTDYLYEILKRADLSSDDIVLTVESYLGEEEESPIGRGSEPTAASDASEPTGTPGFASPGAAKFQEILEEHDEETEDEKKDDGPSPDTGDESSSNLSGGYASRQNVSDILGEGDEVEDDDDNESSEE